MTNLAPITPPDESFLALPGNGVADFRENGETLGTGDQRDGLFYRYSESTKLAVRLALIIGRPLLVMGPSGCGKSSLAFNVARLLRRRYYEFVVHSQTSASDLNYRFDAIRRLGEAQIRQPGDGSISGDWRSHYPFIEPGPLWWAIDPASAGRRGLPSTGALAFPKAIDRGYWPCSPPSSTGDVGSVAPPAVLLIDEIDKGDPDLANNLLVPLGSHRFLIEETGTMVERPPAAGPQAHSAPLIVITSNRERELPEAFVRRCVVLQVLPPSVDELVVLGKEALRVDKQLDIDLLRAVANRILELRGELYLNAAEFLDTVRAILSLNAPAQDWAQIILHTTWKSVHDS